MMDQRILIAGIGNIFLGDDAFGVEVAQQLARRALPAGVKVVDFGIRGLDLAYALLDDYDATIMVDATPRGEAPGTLYVIEPDLDKLDELGEQAIEAHNLDPVKVLAMVKALGGQPRRLLVVGCEPAPLESDEGYMGLSAPVQLAVGEAISLVESLIERIRAESREVGIERGQQP
jgi:hydrogenase maturation protease